MSSPARVLLVMTDSGIGGTEKVVSLVARSLDRDRFMPVVCSVKPAGETADRIVEGGVDLFSLGFEPSGPAGGSMRAALLIRPLAAEIRKRKIDIVHSFLFLANMIGRVAAAVTGRPNISSIRVEEREKGYHHLAERMTKGLVRLYLAPSHRVADYAAGRAGIRRDRIVVIPNAVEKPKSSPPGLRPLVGIGEDERLAGVIGRLHRQKGVDILLRAWKLIPPEERPHLAVIGDGPERAGLEDECRKNGLERTVHFTGWIPEASSLIGELDALIVPSRWEGLPNVVLEGMAAGVPVAAAGVGGVPELIKDGQNGFLFPPEDAAGLASLLRKIFQGEIDAAGPARCAMSMVEEKYRPGPVVRKYEEMYDSILKGGMRAK